MRVPENRRNGVRPRRTLAVLGVLTALHAVGCTTFRPIDYAGPQELADELSTGRRFQIIDDNGDTIELRAISVGPDSIAGTTPDGREIRIALDEIQRIERRAIAPGKTAALTVGLLFVYEAVYVGIAVHAIVTGF
jgi:hypothetical protein